MLLQFRARNVRSFRDELRLSLEATKLAEVGVPRSAPWFPEGPEVRVLPVAAVYGANGSGKSNLLRAMFDMRSVVLGSFRVWEPDGQIPRQPFRLDPAQLKEPSLYEVDVIARGVRHVYGFEIDDQRVVREWAYHYPRSKRPVLIFERGADGIEYGTGLMARGRLIEELVRPNALFLSAAAAARYEPLEPLNHWFQDNLRLADAVSRRVRHAHSVQLLADADRRAEMLAMLRVADLGITDVDEVELDAETSDQIRKMLRAVAEGFEIEDPPPVDDAVFKKLRFHHEGAKTKATFDLDEESFGTQVWFGLIGPVLDSLRDGSVLLADELDASLHPALVNQIVRLYQDAESNPNGAQLICNTHDPALLGDSGKDRVLGRDQVWFTEKSSEGASRLYPLIDYSPRNGESVERRYRHGRYGAVPLVIRSEFANAVSAMPRRDRVAAR